MMIMTIDWFSGYNKALASYMRRIGTDLTTDISPPKSLYIEVSNEYFSVTLSNNHCQVRVLEDHGELETGDGEIVQLKRGTQVIKGSYWLRPVILTSDWFSAPPAQGAVRAADPAGDPRTHHRLEHHQVTKDHCREDVQSI